MSTDDPRVVLAEWIAAAGERAHVLPLAEGRGARVAAALGVSPRALLHAVALHAAGITVDDGWIHVLAGGSDDMRADLASWNGLGADPVFAMTPNLFVVAFDALGGVFAMDGGALGVAKQRMVHYFAPDSLRWESLDGSYSTWLHWLLSDESAVAAFYAEARWRGWRDETRRLGLEDAIHAWPPPWTREGRDLASVSRRAVPAREVVDFTFTAAREIEARDVPGPRRA